MGKARRGEEIRCPHCGTLHHRDMGTLTLEEYSADHHGPLGTVEQVMVYRCHQCHRKFTYVTRRG